MLGAALCAFGAVVPRGYAQFSTAITSDGTLGTTVGRSGNLFNINGGTIKGTNQFHSFGQFSVGTGDIASFNGPAGIQNILSRVTGGTRSEIDGTLRSTISGANLYLLNPSGILFGPNAQLDVSGSFHATTADYIRLADGVRFNAVPSAADPVLTTAPPAAFGFLTSNPAPIDVQAGVFDPAVGITNVLQVPAGKTLSFVGGPINIGAAPDAFAGGFLLAPGGRINIVSVASPGEARFDGTGFSVDSFARLGGININGNSVIDGKEVFIRGGRLVIERASILPGFFFLSGFPVDPPNGGEVNIHTSDSVTIKGPPSDLNGFSGILTFAGSPVPGDVPHISIKSSSISLSEGAVIQTVRLGPGDPANVSLEADTVEIRNGAQVNAQNFFQGPGGTLTVKARDVTLDSADSGQLTSLSAQAFFNGDYGVADETGSFAKAFLPSLQLADSGSITVNATGTLTMRGIAQISTDNFAFGKSGNVTVNAADMLLIGAGPNTGLISAQSRLAGRAGEVTISATGSIDMRNGFRISANTLGSDEAGQVNVRAGRSLTMTGGSTFISSVTGAPLDSEVDSFAVLFDSFFQSTRGIAIPDYASLREALGVSPGPNDLMNVLAALSTISDGAGNPLVAVTKFTPGNGGTVSITAPVLAVNDGAHIETSTVWDGNAGAIGLNVGSLTLGGGAIIGSRSGAERPDRGPTVGSGNAGTVDVVATDTISISGRSASGNGSIVTTSTFGDGNAGDILLRANRVDIQNGGSVRSESGGMLGDQLLAGGGRGGNINITAPQVNLLDGANISANSQGTATALAGNVNIVTDNLIMKGDSSITTQSLLADGGNISIITNGSQVYLLDSQITTSVQSGVGSGGNITIGSGAHPVDALVLNGSQIRADAFGGPGGNIAIFADTFLTSESILSASSALSAPGTINVQARFTNLSGNIAQLPENVVQAAALLRAACAARLSAGKTSSLVVAGREGVPLEPGGVMPSPLIAESLTDLGPSRSDGHEWTPLPGAWRVSLRSKCSM